MARHPNVKIEWSEIDSSFVVFIGEDAVSHGETIEEAINNLLEVIYLNKGDQ